MKTYLLTFNGDPEIGLLPLNRLAPDDSPIQIINLGRSLYFLSAHENIIPLMIVNALIQKNPQPDVYLFPAMLPIHPALASGLEAKCRQLIASSEEESEVA